MQCGFGGNEVDWDNLCTLMRRLLLVFRLLAVSQATDENYEEQKLVEINKYETSNESSVIFKRKSTACAR